MFGWFKKENKTNKELAIEKFKKIGLTFEEADYLAQDIAELSLYADKALFNGEDDNVHSLEEAYKDKYFMLTVNTMIKDNLPDLIKDIAYTGIQARANGLSFEIIAKMRKSVFDYLERSELDNSYFRKAFIQTLNTVNLEKKGSSIIELLYDKGWIEDINNKRYIDSVNTMITAFGEDQAIRNIHTMFDECELWYKQVNDPVTDLQKLTNLAYGWFGGELGDIAYSIKNKQKTPFDLLLNMPEIKEEVKKALKDAEDNSNFNQMDNGYRSNLSDRFIQYMQEEIRLDIIHQRHNNSVDESYEEG